MINKNNQKPKSFKAIGIILLSISVVMIFCIAIGLVTIFMISKTEPNANEAFHKFPLFVYRGIIAFIIFITTLFYIYGSVHLIKYKNWARIMIQIVSLISIIEIWGLMMLVNDVIPNKVGLFSVYSITISIIFTLPLIILIWFLNLTKNKIHFA